MSVHLHYKSKTPVTPEMLPKLRESVENFDDGRFWLLCEPISLAELRAPAQVQGWSKLILQPDPKDIEQASLKPTKDHDLRALVEILCQLSMQYELDWELDLDGEPLGHIVAGHCERQIQRTLDELVDLAKTVGTAPSPEPCRRLEEYEELPQLRIYRGPDA